MKKTSFYKKNATFKNIDDQLIIKYDSQTVAMLWETIETMRQTLALPYKNQHGIKKMHIMAAISYIAVYRVLKDYTPDDAFEIVAEQAKANAQVKRSTMAKLSEKPAFFIFMTSLVSKILFGSAGGFVQKRYSTARTECRFDIEHCPYHTLCKENGCEELCAVFCDADIYTYSHLPKVAFLRTETLGHGGTKCDFCYKIRTL